jgi:hypothetical protein
MLPQAERGQRAPRPAPSPTVHQLPAGCSATLRTTGYNHRLCEFVTPRGTFQGAGHSDWAALSNAQRKAQQAGALSAEGRAL